VKKHVPSTGEVTIFVYDVAGKLVAEYSTTVASPQDAKVAYLTNDHLGTPRVNTDLNARVTARHDYHPFGEEIATSHRTLGLGYVDDTVRQQFTGYERDIESSLDFAQARMYNPAHGRFTTVDPLKESATSNNPQSWNRYTYTFNNPLNYVDPTGLVAMDDYYINRDGSWTVVETQCQCDTYNIETQAGSGEYRELGTLQRNAAGLVEFPGEMDFFTRYGQVDRGGGDHGAGDHFVRPDVAAGLFGVAAVLKDDHGITMSFGDMSSSNGKDPWQPGSKHHAGHGHGSRSGVDVDYRYINGNGESFQSPTARSDSQFSVSKNQTVYDTAKTFGFTENYQGNSPGKNTGLTGPKAVSGHNDHGHLGFSGNGRSQTNGQVVVVTQGAVKRLIFK
jgi:RHS repeat-associated protein